MAMSSVLIIVVMVVVMIKMSRFKLSFFNRVLRLFIRNTRNRQH